MEPKLLRLWKDFRSIRRDILLANHARQVRATSSTRAQAVVPLQYAWSFLELNVPAPSLDMCKTLGLGC
jgi:hypothetical protein